MPSGAGAFPLHTARRTPARDEVRRKRSPLFVVYVNPVPPVKRPPCFGPVRNTQLSCIPLQAAHKTRVIRTDLGIRRNPAKGPSCFPKPQDCRHPTQRTSGRASGISARPKRSCERKEPPPSAQSSGRRRFARSEKRRHAARRPIEHLEAVETWHGPCCLHRRKRVPGRRKLSARASEHPPRPGVRAAFGSGVPLPNGNSRRTHGSLYSSRYHRAAHYRPDHALQRAGAR